MASGTLASQLARYGPGVRCRMSSAQAHAYCRRMAREHYENFHVVSILVPRKLRPHFCSIYAYCRWADDLADEARDPQQSLELLDWWEEELTACYKRELRHPVFIALRDTIDACDIPRGPFLDLLRAFRQDQRVNHYETFDDLLQYCRYSANPVGRLVLHATGCHDERRGALSDAICTGLQLANFWQDVAGDWDRGRVYIPQEVCRRFGCGDDAFAQRKATPAFRRLLAFEVARARESLLSGRPLLEHSPPVLWGFVDLVLRGGLCVLDAIEQIDYDVWERRPVVSKRRKLTLLARAYWNRGCIRPGGRR